VLPAGSWTALARGAEVALSAEGCDGAMLKPNVALGDAVDAILQFEKQTGKPASVSTSFKEMRRRSRPRLLGRR
jgi:hypothetical protein